LKARNGPDVRRSPFGVIERTLGLTKVLTQQFGAPSLRLAVDSNQLWRFIHLPGVGFRLMLGASCQPSRMPQIHDGVDGAGGPPAAVSNHGFRHHTLE
jgi:hypothetical protein